MLKMIKMLRRHALLRVVRTVWSASLDLPLHDPHYTVVNKLPYTTELVFCNVHPEDGLRWPKHVRGIL
jgi:hypothetical protein